MSWLLWAGSGRVNEQDIHWCSADWVLQRNWLYPSKENFPNKGCVVNALPPMPQRDPTGMQCCLGPSSSSCTCCDVCLQVLWGVNSAWPGINLQESQRQSKCACGILLTSISMYENKRQSSNRQMVKLLQISGKASPDIRVVRLLPPCWLSPNMSDIVRNIIKIPFFSPNFS